MSMRRTRALIAAVAVLGLTGAMVAPTLAADPGRHRAHGMAGRLQERLGLTDDQAKAIQEIHARQREAYQQTGQALRQAQIDLRQMALSGAADGAIQTKSAEVEKLLGQMVQLRVKALQEMAPLLTPEQREKLAQLGPGSHRGHGLRHQPPPRS
jgi:Spy/CpxP family protein refolding chaperone